MSSKGKKKAKMGSFYRLHYCKIPTTLSTSPPRPMQTVRVTTRMMQEVISSMIGWASKMLFQLFSVSSSAAKIIY